MAIANESGYGAFLPKYANEQVNREALRGQMVKQASYLTGMDSTYAQLDEQARQFDLSLEQRESQFGRKLDYEYDALEKQAAHWDAQVQLGWGQVEAGKQASQLSAQTSRYGVDAQAKIAGDQLAFNKESQQTQLDFAREKMKTMGDLAAGLGSSYTEGTQPTDPGTKTQTTDPMGGEVKPEQQTIKSGKVSTGPTYYRPGNSGDYARHGNTFSNRGANTSDFEDAMANAPLDW